MDGDIYFDHNTAGSFGGEKRDVTYITTGIIGLSAATWFLKIDMHV